MGVEWVCFGHGDFDPKILKKKDGTYGSLTQLHPN